MKNPNTGKTFLDFDDINKILPDSMKLEPKSVSRSVYITSNKELISISNSKVYEKRNIAWYYVYADRYKEMGVKYMLFTVGLTGFVLLPIEEFQEYKLGCYWKYGRFRGEKRYRIDIKKQGDDYYFVNASQRHLNKLCVTKYFYKSIL